MSFGLDAPPSHRLVKADSRRPGEALFALLLPVVWALAQWLGGAISDDPPAAPTAHTTVAVHPHGHR